MPYSSWFWIIFLAVFLLPSLGYGWGYRRWGAPYPRYIQSRRAAGGGGPVGVDHLAWGWGGDFVWTVMIIGLVWACVTFWWR